MAFTIVELLIAMTIFALVAMVTVNVMVNGMASSKKLQAQLDLHSEGELIMNRLVSEIKRNTIDYEAYYARNVQGETGWETQNYGFYGQSFYDPGSGGWDEGPYSSLSDYWGVLCSDGTSIYPDDCPTETPTYADLDLDTGTHPFTGIGSPYTDDDTSMNALCEDATDCNALEYAVTDELILINSAGDLRTVFTRELFNASSMEYRLSSVKLTGSDSDADGLVDAWVCSSDYTCTGTGDVPDSADLTDTDPTTATDFQAFTPSSINIQDFYVLIAPMEDPYRAFAEEDSQVQPYVTIRMTLIVSEDYGTSFIGETPTLTLQRTVPINVYGEVVSYE